jgi:hypothetical protein
MIRTWRASGGLMACTGVFGGFLLLGFFINFNKNGEICWNFVNSAGF